MNYKKGVKVSGVTNRKRKGGSDYVNEHQWIWCR